MVMQSNPYTGTDRPPTPEEQAALRKIAQLRAGGFSDDEIWPMLQSLSIPTGYEYLPYQLDAAGIQSGYNLGLGNLALGAAEFGYQQQREPYNIISALQFQRDTGSSGVLTDPTLASVPPSPMSKYLGFVDGLLEGGGAGGGSTTSQPSPADLGAVQQQYATNPNATQGFQNYADFDAGQTATAPTTVAPFSPLATQQAASTLLGSSGLPGAPIGEQQLLAGNVPGNSSFTERQRGLMSPDQQSALFGLQASTGRTSNPMAAYAAYQRLYGHRGTGGAGRTIR